MKKKVTIFVVGLACVLMLSVGGRAFSQDFGQLLDAVDQIESNLKALIDKESAARNADITRLETKLEEKSPSSAPVDNQALANLEKKINKLQQRLASAPSGNTGLSDSEVATLVSDIEFLKSEISYMKNLVTKNSQQLASNQGTVAVSSDNKEVIAMVNQLTEVTKDLTEISKHTSGNKASKTTINGKLYSHGLAYFSDDSESHNEFALSRAYVTLRSKLSDNFSLRITSDFKQIDHKYNIILKYAYLDWKPGFSNGLATVRFGMQPTQYIDVMNKFWGRRYLAKTISDQKHFLTSSDLGVSTIIGFGPKSKYGFFSIALLNGTSYTDVEEHNSSKDFNIVAQFNPFKNIHAFDNSKFMVQFYNGTQNESLEDIVTINTNVIPEDTTITTVAASDWKQQIFSAGGLFAWNHTVDVGFDLNFAKYGKGAGHESVSKKGISFFSTFYLKELAHNSSFAKSLNFFARVDLYDPNTDNADDAEIATIFGVESKPVKGFYVALNYRTTSFEDSGHDSENMFYVNTQIKF